MKSNELPEWVAELPPLHRAAATGDVRTLRALIEAGADIDALDDPAVGGTPIGVAAVCGRVESIRALVEAGADIDKLDAVGATLGPKQSSTGCPGHAVPPRTWSERPSTRHPRGSPASLLRGGRQCRRHRVASRGRRIRQRDLSRRLDRPRARRRSRRARRRQAAPRGWGAHRSHLRRPLGRPTRTPARAHGGRRAARGAALT